LQCLSDRIWSFFHNSDLVDVTLTCHGQSMKVHGFILSLFSPILKETLTGMPTNSGDCIFQEQQLPVNQSVNLDFVTDQGTDVNYLLEFLYRGQVTLPETRVKHLLNTAEILGVRELVDAIQTLEFQCTNGNDRASEDTSIQQSEANEFIELMGVPLVETNQSIADHKEINMPSPSQVTICQNTTGGQSTTESAKADSLGEPYIDSAVNIGSSHETSETTNSLDYMNRIEINRSVQEFSQDLENGSHDCEEVTGNFKKEVEEKNDSAANNKCRRRKLKKNPRQDYQRSWRQNRPFLECPRCDYKSRDSSNYKKHMEHHDPSYGSQKYVCDVCSKQFRSRRGFLCHQLGHGDPEKQHKCSVCSFCTPQRWSLIKHLAVLHKIDEKGNTISQDIKCNQCDYICIADHQLKAHILRKHTDHINKPYKCDQCSYATVIKYELEKHVGIRHRHERRYMCEYCSFRSQTHSGLVRHQRIHSGIKPYKCPDCSIEYADGGKFKAHILRHTSDEKSFICHMCAHACRRKDNLRMHLKRIHGINMEESSSTTKNDV